MPLNFTPNMVRAMGLEPAAIYGSCVYSYHIDGDPKFYDAETLPEVVREVARDATAKGALNMSYDEVLADIELRGRMLDCLDEGAS